MAIRDTMRAWGLLPPSFPEKRAVTYEQVFGHDIPREGTRVTTESARRSMAVWACQSLISGDLANLPFQPYRKVSEARVPLTPEPPWIQTPNPLNPNFTEISYRRQVALSLLQDGNAFIAVYPDVFNPVRLLVLNPKQVEIKDGDDMPAYEVRGSNGQRLGVLSPFNLVHIPFVLPPGATRGLNPIEAARQGIAIDLAAQTQGHKFLDGGGLVTGVIEVPGTAPEMNQTQIDQLRDSFKRRREGPNGYSIGVLQGGATFKAVTMSQDDMQYIQTREFSLEEIAGRLYLIPPFMVGSQKPGGVAYASSVERAQHYIDHCLVHYAGPIELGHRRLLPGPETYVKFNFDAFLRGDTKSRYEAYGVGLQNKFLRLEDVWEKEELDIERTGTNLNTPNNNAPDPRITDVGALVRAGFDPAASLAAVGLPPITHTGLVPVTVQGEEVATETQTGAPAA